MARWRAICLDDRSPCRRGIAAPILARTIGGSMQFDLTPAQRALQAKARELARGRIAERAAEIDRTGQYAWDNVALLKRAGFCGMTIPANFRTRPSAFEEALDIV